MQTQVSTDIAQPECSIYRVHGHLRNINDKAYEPEIIAIGPYHRGKDSLKMMEDQKSHYLNLLLQQKKEKFEDYFEAIQQLEKEARKYYADSISLDSNSFTKMLLLDGCFIIELVLKNENKDLRGKNDPIFRMGWIVNSLQRDLMLFENQIPFFVLFELFDRIEGPNQRQRLKNLLMTFFGSLLPGKILSKNMNTKRDIPHLLGLIHSHMLSSFDGRQGPAPAPAPATASGEATKGAKNRLRFIDSATRLREANIVFKKDENASFFHIRYEGRTMFLPPLTIEDRTESFFRNLIAYEQYIDRDIQFTPITDYVKFLNCLIDSSRDVEKLYGYGIINNCLGDDEVAAKMINKLNDSVAGRHDHFIYDDIFKKVDNHCSQRKNRWMAKLRRNIFSSPWAIISFVAAVVLLLLTVAQTVFSVLQVVKR